MLGLGLDVPGLAVRGGAAAPPANWIFSNATTAVDRARYANDITAGIRWAHIDTNNPTGVWANPTGGVRVRARTLPIDGSGGQEQCWLEFFNVKPSLTGLTPKKARLHLRSQGGGTWGPPGYFAVMGCVQSAVLAEWTAASNDASLNYARVSTVTAWSSPLSGFTAESNFGPVATYQGEAAASTWYVFDVLNAVLSWAYGAQEGGFWMFGYAPSGEVTSTWDNSGRSDASVRPYLEVWT